MQRPWREAGRGAVRLWVSGLSRGGAVRLSLLHLLRGVAPRQSATKTYAANSVDLARQDAPQPADGYLTQARNTPSTPNHPPPTERLWPGRRKLKKPLVGTPLGRSAVTLAAVARSAGGDQIPVNRRTSTASRHPMVNLSGPTAAIAAREAVPNQDVLAHRRRDAPQCAKCLCER